MVFFLGFIAGFMTYPAYRLFEERFIDGYKRGLHEHEIEYIEHE